MQDGDTCQEAKTGGLRGMETWWTVQHNTGDVNSRPIKVQDDVRMPSLIQPEVASVVPCQLNAAAATSQLTFARENIYFRLELATEGQSPTNI